jgi:phage shock protein A
MRGLMVQRKGELPEGRTQPVATSSNSPYPFKDSEIERELNELRRKTNDF